VYIVFAHLCFSKLGLQLFSVKTAAESSAGVTLFAAIAIATAIALFCTLLYLLLHATAAAGDTAASAEL
jgi:hypothetical protein